MHVTLEAYRVEHGRAVLGPAADACQDVLEKYATGGPAFTGRLEDGRILGCAGMLIPLPWIADAWMLPTPLVRRYPIAFCKTVRDAFAQIVAGYDLRRVQAAVDASLLHRCQWIERLGFVRETGDAGMRRFGPRGETMHLYAFFPGDAHG